MAVQNRIKKQNFIVRNKLQVIAWLVIFLVVLIKYIFLSGKIDNMGLNFYSTSFLFVFVLALIFSLTIREVIGKAVSYRKSRNQYRNALNMMKTGALAGLLIGILMFAVILISAGRITNLIFKMGAYGTFSMIIVAAAIPLMFFSSAILGCFDGFDFDMPDGASKIIFGVSDLLLSLILVFLTYRMGETHGKLLHDEVVGYAFGAIGAAAGFTGACLIAAIWLFTLFRAFRKKMKGRIAEDVSRNQEGFSEQIIGLLAACGAPFMRFFALYGVLLVNQLLYFKFYKNPSTYSTAIVNPDFTSYVIMMLWYLLPLGISVFLSRYSCEYLEKVMKKDDLYHCGMRIVVGIKQYLCFILPMICIFAVCSSALNESAFSFVTSSSVLPAIACAIWGLAFLEMHMLKGLGKEWLGIGCGLAAFLIQIIYAVLISSKSCTDVTVIMIWNLIHAVVFFVLCSVFIIRFCVYKKNLVNHLLMPFAAVFAAVIVAILCMFLRKAIGNIPAFIIAAVISFGVHSLTLVVTGCVKEGERSEFPQGAVLGMIGKLLGMYSG